jgi:hypothetical protein
MPSQPGTLNFGECALTCCPLLVGAPHPRYNPSTAWVLFGPVVVPGVFADFCTELLLVDSGDNLARCPEAWLVQSRYRSPAFLNVCLACISLQQTALPVLWRPPRGPAIRK